MGKEPIGRAGWLQWQPAAAVQPLSTPSDITARAMQTQTFPATGS